ncbi:methionyl-tRNA formyltransferase [Fusibacter paucivorans]|uniref:Methionyl-tRNA formyltransferase n=1 Tax=Fusibacter paucivorans TaxID=76009 RepID=A0ABS5PS88_9FIRM|nr:methionyl-tRNA formyltransferase [Fusibacter paucivorans]MBS7527431.1 methionyl-tRNA formyltransferase [Fusibacter paucivorans]
MKIVFMGTPEIAIPTLEACIEHHEVIAVFTQPDRPSGRGKKMTPPAVKVTAEKHGIPVYQPEKIKTDDWVRKIEAMAPDVIVVLAFGQILSKAILEIAKYGAINVHASLLPKYRGAAPINWAIVNGERESGVTTMQMDPGIDTGDMLLRDIVPIDQQMTAGELHDHLMVRGAALLLKTLEAAEAGMLNPEKQEEQQSSYAPMISRKMGDIKWSEAAGDIMNRIRGFNPWPICYTQHAETRMKIFKAEAVASEGNPQRSGEIIEVAPTYIKVACGEGALKIYEIQYGNGKRMSVKSFLLGHTLTCGEILKEA